MPFYELDHTADVLMRVRAPTPEELFAEAGRALMTVMFGSGEDRGILQSFSVSAESREELLHDFLSELLFISETEQIVFAGFELELEGTCLHVIARGETFDPEKHRGGTEVKGISYFGLEIVRDEQGYKADILFDV
jgi:SHS2 domain-containing protein